jgi:hypothetical protein
MHTFSVFLVFLVAESSLEPQPECVVQMELNQFIEQVRFVCCEYCHQQQVRGLTLCSGSLAIHGIQFFLPPK